MSNKTQKNKFKPIYKKFVRLKVNPLNNNKLLKLIKEPKKYVTKKVNRNGKVEYRKIEKKGRNIIINRFKKQKWSTFLSITKKKFGFFRKFKPYTFFNYSTSKFASPGNSFKRKFRNDLLAKKIFSYFYGNLKKKYLKQEMTKLYRSKRHKNLVGQCMELFESRLDSVLYRSKFCASLKDAKQLISHKHVIVNNRIEKNRSYILKKGDLIKITSSSVNLVKTNLQKQLKQQPKSVIWPWPLPPNYLHINYKTLEIIFGNIKDFNFSTSFNFKMDVYSLIISHYRH